MEVGRLGEGIGGCFSEWQGVWCHAWRFQIVKWIWAGACNALVHQLESYHQRRCHVGGQWHFSRAFLEVPPSLPSPVFRVMDMHRWVERVVACGGLNVDW